MTVVVDDCMLCGGSHNARYGMCEECREVAVGGCCHVGFADLLAVARRVIEFYGGTVSGPAATDSPLEAAARAAIAKAEGKTP